MAHYYKFMKEEVFIRSELVENPIFRELNIIIEGSEAVRIGNSAQTIIY